MLGAIVGDIVGSVYEFDNTKSTDFELFYEESCFTDDTVMTLAVAKWLIEDETHSSRHLVRCMGEHFLDGSFKIILNHITAGEMGLA